MIGITDFSIAESSDGGAGAVKKQPSYSVFGKARGLAKDGSLESVEVCRFDSEDLARGYLELVKGDDLFKTLDQWQPKTSSLNNFSEDDEDDYSASNLLIIKFDDDSIVHGYFCESDCCYWFADENYVDLDGDDELRIKGFAEFNYSTFTELGFDASAEEVCLGR